MWKVLATSVFHNIACDLHGIVPEVIPSFKNLINVANFEPGPNALNRQHDWHIHNGTYGSILLTKG